MSLWTLMSPICVELDNPGVFHLIPDYPLADRVIYTAVSLHANVQFGITIAEAVEAFREFNNLFAERVIYTAGLLTPSGVAHIIISRSFLGYYYPVYDSPTIHARIGSRATFEEALQAAHSIALEEASNT